MLYKGLHKQILFHCRARERGKTYYVVVKEHQTIDFLTTGKADLFDKSKVWKKVARDKVAEQLNAKSLVRVAGEQCSNKWKKNRGEVQKVREHNAKTGNLKTQWWPVNYSTGDSFLLGYSIHRSKSSVAEVIDFLTEFKEEKRKEE